MRNTERDSKENPMKFLMQAMLVGSSESIEMMEAEGQTDFVESDVLPMRMTLSNDKEKSDKILSNLGFKLGPQVEGDLLFRKCELPEGWTKRGTEHSMWSEILDEKGRVRMSVFYKAAFYDRKAHFSMERFFSIKTDYDTGVVRVMGGDVEFFNAGSWSDNRDGKINYELSDKIDKKVRAWLDQNHPNHNEPFAYWDDDLKPAESVEV